MTLEQIQYSEVTTPETKLPLPAGGVDGHCALNSPGRDNQKTKILLGAGNFLHSDILPPKHPDTISLPVSL